MRMCVLVCVAVEERSADVREGEAESERKLQ